MAVAELVRPRLTLEAPKRTIKPLSFVPEAKNRLVSSELISVAGHELNHALVAYAYGVSVASISVIPSGDSLGRTCLGGLVGNEAMKVIAAGGGVHTHDGSAWGYGSDKHKVDYLHYFNGGHSWDSARSQAEAIVGRYSKSVRKKAAEIIAFLGEVSGSMLPEILKRAQLEVAEEKGGILEELPEIKIQEQQYKGYTVIERLPNNISRVRYVGIIEKKDEEKLICGVCHGINAHAEKCPNAGSSLKSGEKVRLPNQGVIFETVI